mmetsp:Transcript_13954/g.28451  ORF Transcript_13954/g.28451 Transcript_13954/m.28451 type:complete len:619 (+) Transcript_13954:130-1986(+)
MYASRVRCLNRHLSSLLPELLPSHPSILAHRLPSQNCRLYTHQSTAQSNLFIHQPFSTQAIMADDDNNNNSSASANDDGNNKKGNKQRKASKWQALKKKKKEQKRKKLAAANGVTDTTPDGKKRKFNTWNKKYDEGSVTPHEGSFAHPEMQKLFDVKIVGEDVVSEGETDVKSDAEKKVEDGTTESSAAATEGSVTEATATTEASATSVDTDKVPKRKLACLVSFLGSDYSGFQINSLTKSLHAEIELGLYRAGLISKSNFGHPNKYSWSNSARTDKGVHAAAQVCSFKGEMIYHHEIDDFAKQLDAMREKVNECLPDDVRILDFERVTRTFCARTSRDKVRYQYMVPSFLFCSPDEARKAFAADDVGAASLTDKKMTPMEASIRVQDDVSPDVIKAARAELLNYRVSQETLQRLRDGLKLFEGTHSFHNYTRRMGADNASATRYILKFAPLEPVLVPGSEDQPETQWVPVQVTGQSFLLNQIRKMISAAVDHARGVVSTERVTQSMSKDCRMKVNVAPAQGLFLDRSFFELYNKHKVTNAPKHGNQPELEMLDWVEEDEKEIPAAVRRIEEFKNQKIIPHIVREEALEGNFVKYLYAQDVLYAQELYSLIEDDKDKE